MDITPPFSQELVPDTLYAVKVVSSSQIVRIGVEGMQHCVPVRMARTEIFLPLGGDTLWPGDAMDMQGPFFLKTAAGPKSFVWCENRGNFSGRYSDPMGVMRAQMTWKPAYRDLEPGVWTNLMSNVQGQNGVRLAVKEGCAWVGTHLNPSVPPHEADPNMQGVPIPLTPEDGWFTIRGNPSLYAYAYSPTRVWFIREQNAWF